MAEPELPRRQVDRRAGERHARPAARQPRVERHRHAHARVGGLHGADEVAVLGRFGRVVAARDIDLDILEATLVEMRAQLGDAVVPGHVRYEPHVDLGDGAARQDGLAAGAGIARDQPLDVDCRLRGEALERLLP